MPINKTELSEELNGIIYRIFIGRLNIEMATTQANSVLNKAISEAKKEERERILPILHSIRANSPISGAFANNRKQLDELIKKLSQSTK